MIEENFGVLKKTVSTAMERMHWVVSRIFKKNPFLAHPYEFQNSKGVKSRC